MKLKDVSAIVTGGAGGFGAATVRRLVAAGAKVVIADLAEDRGKALAGVREDGAQPQAHG
jgi:NAD(P)-dependent dehydrogenase (short-subunit alcohol dehydrogenase family)